MQIVLEPWSFMGLLVLIFVSLYFYKSLWFQLKEYLLDFLKKGSCKGYPKKHCSETKETSMIHSFYLMTFKFLLCFAVFLSLSCPMLFSTVFWLRWMVDNEWKLSSNILCNFCYCPSWGNHESKLWWLILLMFFPHRDVDQCSTDMCSLVFFAPQSETRLHGLIIVFRAILSSILSFCATTYFDFTCVH